MKVAAYKLSASFGRIGFPAKALSLAILMTMILGLSAASQADSTAVYYAVYCSNSSSSLSLAQNRHSVVGCSGSGSSPNVETKVSSLSTNPKGDNPVTIVEADCYPGTPQSLSSSTGRVSCSEGPDATLTIGSHFAAAKKSAPAKKKSSNPSGKSNPTKSKNPNPTAQQSGISSKGLPQVNATTDTVKIILQILFGFIGAFALLMTTASGFKYITSAGNPQKTSEAKSGVVYAIVGLMLAITAEAIVAFVVHWGSP